MNIFEKLGINSDVLLLILLAAVLVYTVLLVIWLVRYRHLAESYDLFMRGKDAESLEDTIKELCGKVEDLAGQDVANKDVIRVLNRQLVNSYQRTGLVKYNAFEGMGGQASFALTLLDLNNNGILINVIHSRNSCYTYLKEIKGGMCEVVLGAEEKESLIQAMKKRDRFFNPDEQVLED